MATDRRIKYTKMVLRQALLEILQERPIERVTVKEICDRADVNRSTFYVHYGSPQELLDGIQREMYEEIKEKKKDFTNIKAYMADMCDIIYDNRELMQVMLKAGKAETMFDIASIWKEDFLKGTDSSGLSRAEAEATFLYITCGAMAVITTWLLGHLPMTRDQVVDKVYSLTMNGLKIYSKEEDSNV